MIELSFNDFNLSLFLEFNGFEPFFDFLALSELVSTVVSLRISSLGLIVVSS